MTFSLSACLRGGNHVHVLQQYHVSRSCPALTRVCVLTAVATTALQLIWRSIFCFDDVLPERVWGFVIFESCAAGSDRASTMGVE